MANIDLSKYGITGAVEVLHNPSYEVLFQEETKAGLEGFEKGQETELGAVNVMTGVYTGRSPKDKFFVMDEVSKDTVWWTSDEYKNDNKPVTEATWAVLKDLAVKELSGKKLYVMDTFCGANENSRLKVRFIMEVAWQAHFVKNMFIRPTEEELANYGEPDFVVYNASKAKVDNYAELGLNSETAVVFNLTSKEQVILNTWYGGEMKKGMFSIMNYLLPLRGMASMHCSANVGHDGDTAIFFGLSGTGKTTLSTDPKRQLIGDDEHGWDDDSVFNFEGGCYAKVINLDKESEPDIYAAIKRNALLDGHASAVDALQSLTELGGLVFVHGDLHLQEGFDQKFAPGQNGVNVLFEVDIAAFARVIDDSRSRGLGAKLQALQHGAILLCIVRVFLVLRVLRLLGSRRLFLAEGVFEVVIQGFNCIMLGRRGLFFNGLEINVDAVALRKIRQKLILLRRVIVFHPTAFENREPFERKLLQLSDLDRNLHAPCYAILRAENRHRRQW